MKRSRSPHDQQGVTELSQDSRLLCPAHKIVGVTNQKPVINSVATMRCSLPPHKEPLAFRSYGDYEAHYTKEHVYRCAECHKNLPSAHFLDLHFEECHDPFAAVQRDNGEHTYSCFAEDCERKCRTPQKRRMHAIDKHMFPKNYFFAVTKEGIDGRSSLLLGSGHHRRKSSGMASTLGSSTQLSVASPGRSGVDPAQRVGSDTGSDTAGHSDDEMEGLTGAMSALQFVPPSIQFGRSGRKSGFAKR